MKTTCIQVVFLFLDLSLHSLKLREFALRAWECFSSR